MNFTEAIHSSKGKTRLMISQKMENLVLEIIQFHNFPIDVISINNSINNNTDFVVFFTDDWSLSEEYKPNLIWCTENLNLDLTKHVISNIVNGGILVYSENNFTMSEASENANNFFRSFVYTQHPQIDTNTSAILLETDFGNLKLSVKKGMYIDDIEGAKLTCQQLGIMEEEFYEAIVN